MRTKRISAPILVLALAACGGGGSEQAQAGAETDESKAAAATPAVDPATVAAVTGVVRFEGAAPTNEAIDMSAEPTCAQKHPTKPMKQTVVINSNKTLRNTFVYVKSGLPAQKWATPSQPVVLDQVGCEYQPHVLAVQTGQTLAIKNSDGLLHNVNAKATVNRGFNTGQPTNMTTNKTFASAEVMIPVTCEVHGWMEAYIAVVDHPYHAVTGPDGSFRIENLPPGTYTIETWHEKYGTKTAQVTVAAKDSRQVDFSYNAAAVATVPLGKPLDPHGQHAGSMPAGHR